MKTRIAPLAFSLVFALSVPCSAEPAADARNLLDESGNTGGLVVHLGCGDGSLALAIAEANPSLLVHALDRDAAKVEQARQHFRESNSASTRISGEVWTENKLPHAENLVNLLIVSGGFEVSDEEANRVLAPGGTVLRDGGGEWKASKKPHGDGRGEWTHYQFDASNNMVGDDPQCGLPRRFQWAGTPLWSTSHENMSSLNAMVSANGRVFYIIDEGPRASVQLPADWQLVARDAYNGVVLWRKPISQWLTRFWPWKSGPAQMPRKLVAVGDRVYAPLDINGALKQFDAATGKELQTYEGTAAAEEFILTEGILLVQVNPDPSDQAKLEEERRKRRNFNYDSVNRALIDHDKAKRIVAIEAESGKQLWERVGPKVSPLSLGALNGNVVYHNGERVVCVDLKSGAEKWVSEPVKSPLKLVSEESPTLVLRDDKVFFAMDQKMTTLSLADGKTLWTSDWTTNDYRSPVTVMAMQGLVWSMNITSAKAPGTFTGRDPVTGEVKSQFDLPPFQGIGHHRCYKAKASGDFVLLSRSGVEYVDPTKQSYAENHWIRGGCLYGILPANGMLYSTPHACACYLKGKMNGFTAMTPGPTGPAAPPDATLSPHQKGPAYLAKLESAAREDDWPTYRGNVERSGATKFPVKTDLKAAWTAQLGGDLSSLTVGEGLVLVSQRDRNTVHAIR
ncbi:MAG: PQQ-binding-like beta-propeller repeat protein, partial [Verrucomicrobiae bacterium]|nr:PQQ-binding-like beta-propeller repeat protein [Verrucomicrobiae bacterium]